MDMIKSGLREPRRTSPRWLDVSSSTVVEVIYPSELRWTDSSSLRTVIRPLEARGFIESSFLKGLDPHEFFSTPAAGGIIDTAVKSVWEKRYYHRYGETGGQSSSMFVSEGGSTRISLQNSRCAGVAERCEDGITSHATGARRLLRTSDRNDSARPWRPSYTRSRRRLVRA
jgi:hypothetical protein